MKTPFALLGLLLSTFLLGPVAQAEYSDIQDYEFKTAAEYLTEEGIISGYSDGTLRPDQSINRAEFLTVVLRATGHETSNLSECFSDVKAEWFAPYICTAKEDGLVNGYADGSFAPNATVNLVEALQIVVKAFDVETVNPEGDAWYSAALETLAGQNAIPYTLDYYSETLTRGEAFELIWRVVEGKQDQKATTLGDFKGSACVDFEPETYDNIDLDRVRDAWLGWTNASRAYAGLSAYTHNTQLDRTALVWSQTSRDRGYMDHKRPGTSAYYDYYAIQDWFSDLGLTFNSNGGYTFTENIGHGPYSCSADDCTDELIDAIEYTYDYFISEAGSSYRPHYNSIMNSYYTQIGFGIVVTDSSYYLTVHYATDLNSTVAFCD